MTTEKKNFKLNINYLLYISKSTRKTAAFVTCRAVRKRGNARIIVHYDTSAMKRFLTSVSLQREPKVSDVRGWSEKFPT